MNCQGVISTDSPFYLHSIRTRIKTFKNGMRNHMSFNSIFIPLEQGLRQAAEIEIASALKFYLHSIRTRIKTRVSLPRRDVRSFYCHSIGTRIKTPLHSVGRTAGNSIVIPLEQGLRQEVEYSLFAELAFYCHSIRTRIKTIINIAITTIDEIFYCHSIRTRIKTIATLQSGEL